MASNTSRLNLLKKNPVTDGADTFNIETMLNGNWQKIDDKVALVDANGKVINKDGTPAGGVTEAELDEHKADDVRHVTSADRTKWDGKQAALAVENRRKITFGTAVPTGGVDGDVYFQYE